MANTSPLRTHLLAFFWASATLIGSSAAAQTFNDPCFTSPTVGTSFAGTANISNNNADLIRWTGSAWTGGWGGAAITLAPPGSVVNTRAIWMGDGTVWTTGGEGFGMRLSSGIVTGTTYTWNWTRVSHGTGSAGSFAPRIYTNTTGTMGYLIGNIPVAGSSWFTGPISFTAVAAQSGHTWVYFHTNTPNGSGMFLACEAVVLPMRLWDLRGWKSDAGNIVQWTAADEDGFVEHVLETSPDGLEYSPVGSLPVKHGAGEHLYTLKDPSAGPSQFYRVRTLHADGNAAFSPVIEITAQPGTADVLSLSPNPSQPGQPVTLEIFCPQAQTVRMSLTDLQGRVIWQRQQDQPAGFGTITLQDLPSRKGLHWLTLSGNDWSRTLSISQFE